MTGIELNFYKTDCAPFYSHFEGVIKLFCQYVEFIFFLPEQDLSGWDVTLWPGRVIDTIKLALR